MTAFYNVTIESYLSCLYLYDHIVTMDFYKNLAISVNMCVIFTKSMQRSIELNARCAA